jgi:hypothetical protein
VVGTRLTGFIGSLVLMRPWGSRSPQHRAGSNQVKVYGATVGIDFLRLTVYRTTLQSFWSNPFLPAHTDGSR